MLKKVLLFITNLSFSDSNIRVNRLFFKKSSGSYFFSLKDSFIFQHACMTPLTILSCTLDNIESAKSKKEIDSRLLVARQAVKRITTLIKSVSLKEDKNQNFLVNNSIQEVLILFKRKNNCKVGYFNFIDEKTILSGNKLYFQEMLVCLLNNAVEAYDDNSSVHISLVVKKVKSKINIHIVDYAKGMSLITQKIALIQGVTHKENGLGIGLFFTKKIAEEEFCGKMKINSRLGMGTHIQIIIPIQEPCSQNP